jgi:S-adenosylmethionine:tRNA ribosyltransferase-isomerase
VRAASVAQQRPRDAKLLAVDTQGRLRHAARIELASLLRHGDLLVANDAATLPASLHGVHERSGGVIEVRLAGRKSLQVDEVREFTAVVFGAGDHRTRTEDRPAPPALHAGDRLRLGPLRATVLATLDHPRLVALHFDGSPDAIWAGLARHGKPIQYAHMQQPLKLWDVWTQVAALPAAFEPPSAGFVLDWTLLDALRERGVGFATLTHAAGLSSTGDAALDARLPFDEPYRIPASTVRAIERTRETGGRVIALGTTVTRALESAWPLRAGDGIATQRLGPHSRLRIIDAILSGTHGPGSSHHELLRAFVSDAVLKSTSEALERHGYLTHEFGDSVLIEASEGSRQQLQAEPGDDDHRVDRHAHGARHVEEGRQHRRPEHALDEAADPVAEQAAP